MMQLSRFVGRARVQDAEETEEEEEEANIQHSNTIETPRSQLMLYFTVYTLLCMQGNFQLPIKKTAASAKGKITLLTAMHTAHCTVQHFTVHSPLYNTLLCTIK